MTVVSLLHAIVAILLAAYGINTLLMTLLYVQRRRQRPLPPSQPQAWPRVTVQLPIYNELHVVERLVQAVAELDYPRDRLQVQVLDDSTDETTAIALAAAEQAYAKGLDIQVMHRDLRQGYKAGALAAGLEQARGEFIAIFDADFVPHQDFLRRTVPYLATDDRLGFLQTRWDHLNAHYSLLTQAQALALDGHFAIEQTVRQRSGWYFGFNGTAGLWRRECIERAGGWQSDTLCEDLDLSYRAQLQGWRGLYLPDVPAPAEIPPQLAAFKRQQARWATGSIQAFRKLAGKVIQAPRPLMVRLEGLIHLGAYFCHPLLLALLVLTLPLLWFEHSGPNPLRWLLTYLGLASLGPPVLYAVSQWELYSSNDDRNRWLKNLLALPLLMLLGTGLAVSNTVAVVQGLRGQPGPFQRTPKFRVEQKGDQWQGKRYTLPLTRVVVAELALTVYALITVALAIQRGHLYAVPFLLLYGGGFSLMVLLGWTQGRGVRPARRNRARGSLAEGRLQAADG